MLGWAPDGIVAPPGLLTRPVRPSTQPVNELPGSGPKATGIATATVSTMLTKMAKSGELAKAERGYKLPQ